MCKLFTALLFCAVLLEAAECARRIRPLKGLAARKKQIRSDGETFVVLVAGSNGWYNYRHQADVAHAYHTLKNHGIPDENMIVMMYDDVANHKMNPYKGKLFNKPHGKDLYKGLKIDYRGDSVTPDNFLNVIKGNSSGIRGGNGRVLNTNEDDRIFIYFTDHGAVGLISFPDEMLTVKQLNEALTWMHKNNRFSQLVFYLEACESGSMFEKVLKDDLNIYAITAANGHESSWGTFCENDMNLPCLGDLFSVNWMSDSDVEDLSTETLQYQYDLVKKETNLSHVMQFGDLDIAQEAVGLFQGESDGNQYYTENTFSAKESINWPSRDIELNHLISMQLRSNNALEKVNLHKRIRMIRESRHSIKKSIHMIVEKLFEFESDDLIERMFMNKRPVLDVDCHHDVVNLFKKYCIDFTKHEYALKYVNVLNNMCIELGGKELLKRLPDICLDVNISVELRQHRHAISFF
ncbi:unnamed protein product [Caenorhabditis bovis]|uniref:legumain n=1 Tax=Caenorhabditis bovis TaxID=2654633 RepID=A0A8S1EAQ6_9PELO|nr:unnamed protein product [Caenorhabditis bovis]